MNVSREQKAELERQLECLVNRARMLAESRRKGSLIVDFDGSGFLGKIFRENFIIFRDIFSPEKMIRQMNPEDLVSGLTKELSMNTSSREG